MPKNSSPHLPSSNRPPRAKDIPAVQKNDSTDGRMLVAQQLSLHSGPLPPAEEFARYEAVCPGAADRILALAERQAGHRQNMERMVVSRGSRDSFCGLLFGFVLGMACIVGGIICAVQGIELAGLGISFTGIASLVGVFVYGSNQRRKEREAKARMMQQS